MLCLIRGEGIGMDVLCWHSVLKSTHPLVASCMVCAAKSRLEVVA